MVYVALQVLLCQALDKIYEEGAVRYVNEIPPGYKDGHKTEEFLNRGVLYKSKFGDLILYKQILKFSLDTKIKNVIFISEDSKKDWKESVPHENNINIMGVKEEKFVRKLLRRLELKFLSF